MKYSTETSLTSSQENCVITSDLAAPVHGRQTGDSGMKRLVVVLGRLFGLEVSSSNQEQRGVKAKERR